jgi:RsiW-degrading membrane proteinase PrsW (M82 family)
MNLSSRSGILGHRGLWLAGVGQIVALLIFIGLVYFIAPSLPAELSGGALVTEGIIIALIPALVWLAFFYQQDRLEPEPKANIIGVFILGALLAKAVGIPLVQGLFSIGQWLYTDVWSHLLGSILVIGFLQEFLKYAAVRYSVYGSAEFDERVDGVIYATVAGLGFATMLNFDYVVSRGGVDITVGAIRVTITALAHASIAGVWGYFLGQVKFEHTPPYYLPGGFALAAVLNGLFFWAQDLVTLRGVAFKPWYGLVLAVVIAVIVLAVVFWFIRKANAETLALAKAGGGS